MSDIKTNKFGTKIWRNENGDWHREDGPAVVFDDGSHIYYVDNKNITNQVEAWIKGNDFPDYNLWTDGQKLMFRIAFSGTTS